MRDASTIALYEQEARRYEERRRATDVDEAETFADQVPAGALRADLGCGPGLYSGSLGSPLVGLDAARAMLERARANAPALVPVQADLGRLPFRPGALSGGWARMSYLHLPVRRVPRAFAELHRALAVDAPIHLRLLAGDGDGLTFTDDDFPGRFFSGWSAGHLTDVLVGAGFGGLDVDERTTEHGARLRVRGRRLRTLPDTVGPSMRVLVCGLNPSLHAADAGVGYAGPGNRFWRAAVEAGLVERAHDPWAALDAGMGMTDLVKRATPRAAELSPDEYRAGATRLERLVEWLRPGAVCFVGLTGWRAAVDRRAQAGWQPAGFAGRPAYVMPSTSGLNTHTSFDDLVAHLREVTAAAGEGTGDGRSDES